MLQVKNVKKAYHTGGFTQVALDDVSVSFRDSEFAAILGASGSGKTTLLNIIGGLDRYDSGDLVIDGISTKQYKSRDWDTFRNNRVGFVFQSYNLIMHQSVLQNVELALTLSGVTKKEREKRAIETLNKVGLGDHIKKRPNQLSGGQMQRVAIARALINDPEILLADEPTGALDSKTSVEVMDLLAEIAKDRLVVMVTHNPELAEQYATRIVNLQDGHIISDSMPYEPTLSDIEKVSSKKTRKSRMSFLTALSLSFNNLMTKKGRTIMTAFAGSVGIIGIAAILALSNGVNAYIEHTEEQMLSSSPIQVNKSGMDLSALMGTATEEVSDANNENSDSPDEGLNTKIKERSVVNNMVSKMKNNDLASLKEYLDSDEANKIKDASNYIDYNYGIQPRIFVEDKDGSNRQVNPDTSLSAFGLGSSEYTNSSMSTMMSSNIFSEMVDVKLVQDEYDVKAGHWPEKSDECVLVLSESGAVSDMLLYSLGIKDHKEFEEIVKAVANEQEYEIKESGDGCTYSDILNVKLKYLPSAELYEKDETLGVWADKSSDENFVKDKLNNAKDLKIAGIVQKKKDADSSPLLPYVYYTESLTDEIIDASADYDIVKEQIANKETDVFSGKPFGEKSESNADLSNLITVDEGAISAAFKFDTSALNLDMSDLNVNFDANNLGNIAPIDEAELMKSLSGADISVNTQAFAEYSAALLNDYFAHLDEIKALAGGTSDPEILVETYLRSDYARAVMERFAPQIFDTSKISSSIMNGLSSYMQKYMQTAISSIARELANQMQTSIAILSSQLQSNLANAMSVDADAMKNAFKMDITPEQLQASIMAMMSDGTSTYESNLTKLNYADRSQPTGINIYASSFDTKEIITNELDAYNQRMNEQDGGTKAISYTDIVGQMMSGIKTIIDMISYMLIAFVSISLVVSSIMIGIITYISVLERRKEIGILRAIGASRRNVSQIFNAETIIEGLVAGVMGILITVLICVAASGIFYLLIGVENIAYLPLSAALILIGISVILSFIAGLLPASSASRKDPVEALRSE